MRELKSPVTVCLGFLLSDIRAVLGTDDWFVDDGRSPDTVGVVLVTGRVEVLVVGVEVVGIVVVVVVVVVEVVVVDVLVVDEDVAANSLNIAN